ncbi:cell envelope integrity protein TolA [Paenibacillus woosongensis]|uniref:Lipoprotein n=1 Tax=Paenibacillus woosongensis TaxID=307580 RepID=A0ABQ4MRA1_9BACL|nr:cell envelope integrity protein TolA [Paenibacillus woosongensis]GIP58530.1 hypothetical protein J15TS10_23440 [Paenibacillus woosongensis]
MKNLKLAAVIFVIAVVVSACGTSDGKISDQTNSSSDTKQQEIEAENEKLKAEAERLKKELADKEAEEKAKLDEEISVAAQEQDISSGDWNITDENPTTSGNILVGLEYMEKSGPLKNGSKVDISKVFKAPWDYYGEPIAIKGYAQIVQDYPPNPDNFLRSEIVMLTDNETIIDVLSTVPSGDIQENDLVSLTGLVIGRMEVPNAIGGTFTHLIVLTNNFE